jgi:hypothetical protein
MYIKKEHYSNFCTFEIASLVNVPGHYLRKYGTYKTGLLPRYARFYDFIYNIFDMTQSIRNFVVLTCAFGSAELIDLTDKMTAGNIEPLPECKSFDPILTNRGVCHTFNAISFRGMARDTHYMNTFTDTYHPKESDEVLKIPGK